MKQRAEQHFFESAGGKAGEVVGGGHPGVFPPPFNEASINQIIKEAGIPRGSFYMYFQDKEDLFRYLLKGNVDQLFMLLEEFLLRNGGDIFQALLDLYDYVQAKIDNQHLGEIGAMDRNHPLQQRDARRMGCWKCWMRKRFSSAWAAR